MAVEYQRNEFALGVQFHPEADAMESETFLTFFDTLVYAALRWHAVPDAGPESERITYRIRKTIPWFRKRNQGIEKAGAYLAALAALTASISMLG